MTTEDTKSSVIIVCAGKNGLEALEYFGAENVLCFADNSIEKQQSGVSGKSVRGRYHSSTSSTHCKMATISAL